MKILLITDNHSPDGGGAEKYFFTLKEALQTHHDLTIYSLGFGPENKIQDNFIVLKESPHKLLRLWWRMFFNPIKYLQIKSAIKKINPDVIHLHNVKKYTISLLKAVKGYNVIQTVHDFGLICPTGWNVHQNCQPCETGLQPSCMWQHNRNQPSIVYLGMLYSFFRMRKLLKRAVTTFISPSPLLARYLEMNHFDTAIYLPPFRNETSTSTFDKIKPYHFLYVGQLGKHKGVDTLIREFSIAYQQNPNLILKIAGSGTQEKALKQQVKELQLEKNIFFLGWGNPTTLYDECMALIFPSIGLESFGLVITEAMSHSRPVIGSDRGPTSWLVDNNETGLLFDPLKPGDLAEKILVIAENKSLVAQYGRKGCEKMAGFLTNQAITDKMIDLYKNAMASR